MAFALYGLSACTLGPNFARPAAPATTAYTAEPEVVAPEQRIALGRNVADQWWSLFASAPLDAVIHQAITDNYSLAAAHETVAQAEQMVKAESGGLYPQLGVNGQVGRQQYGVALFGPANFSIPPFTYYEVGPTLNWTLDLFGAKRRAVERQRALAE
jgi:outer membrane protein TolC